MNDYIKELNNEFKKNENNIIKNKGIIHELNLKDFKEKAGRVTLLSTLLYLPTLLIYFWLNIPSVIFPGATLFTSFALGYIGNAIIEKKARCKERFKNISKSKNESERIEEILKLEIEIEKLHQRNEIITRVNNKQNEESNMIKKFSKNENYTIKKNKSNYSRRELVNKINELERELKQKYILLDNLSNQLVIKNKSNDLNDKLSPIFYSMMAAFVPMALSIMPIFSYTVRPLPAPSVIPLITTFVPAILAFGGSLTYYGLNKKHTKNAIKSINKDNSDDKNIHVNINKLKTQIANIIYSLNSYRNELENNNYVYDNGYTAERNLEPEKNDDLNLEDGPKLILK